jgi:class 3 adenylate cyclase
MSFGTLNGFRHLLRRGEFALKGIRRPLAAYNLVAAKSSD